MHERRDFRLWRRGDLGEIFYYDSTRVNLGLFQHDVNVIWDLAVHDLSVLDFLLQEQPVAVSASGAGHIRGKLENMAHLSLFYPSGIVAYLNVNWLAPVKVRQTLIGGSKQMIVWNDLEPSEKVKVYDRGVTLGDAMGAGPQLLNVFPGVGDGRLVPYKSDGTPLNTQAAPNQILCLDPATNAGMRKDAPGAPALQPDDPSWDAWNPWLARERDPHPDGDEDQS